MELIKMKCPSCNADLELNPALKEAFCVYCGSKILLAGMESTNALGQPVADEHLVEMLKTTGPLLTRNSELTATLNKKNTQLQTAQRKLAGIRIPLINNDQLDFFKPKHEKLYLLIFILGAVWATICMFIPYVGFLLTLLLFAPAAVAMFFLYKGTRNKQIYLQTIAKTQQEISSIQQELNANKETLSKYNLDAIPAKYRSGKTFNFFAEVLSDQRATNVSQAINLYENELRNQKMEAIQQKQLEKIEQLTRENAAIKAELNRRQ